jgi:hypothetical protein
MSFLLIVFIGVCWVTVDDRLGDTVVDDRLGDIVDERLCDTVVDERPGDDR